VRQALPALRVSGRVAVSVKKNYKDIVERIWLDGKNNQTEILALVARYEADGWKYIGAIPQGVQNKAGQQEVVLMFRKMRD
jgi:hypothetical protein